MSQFMRFFSGKFQHFGKCAGVKHLTNIMSVSCCRKFWLTLIDQRILEVRINQAEVKPCESYLEKLCKIKLFPLLLSNWHFPHIKPFVGVPVFMFSKTQFRHCSKCVLEYFAQQGIFEDILDGHLCLLLSVMLQLSTHLLFAKNVFFLIFLEHISVKISSNVELLSGRGFCKILLIGIPCTRCLPIPRFAFRGSYSKKMKNSNKKIKTLSAKSLYQYDLRSRCLCIMKSFVIPPFTHIWLSFHYLTIYFGVSALVSICYLLV